MRVLFVCPAGSVKSAIAREVLKRRAADEGLSVSVASRGVHPEDHVSAALAVKLKSDGINPGAEPLSALEESDITYADIVIAFDDAAEVPILQSARAWKTPSWNDTFAAAKDDLDNRVTGLVSELRSRSSRPCAAQ